MSDNKNSNGLTPEQQAQVNAWLLQVTTENLQEAADLLKNENHRLAAEAAERQRQAQNGQG